MSSLLETGLFRLETLLRYIASGFVALFTLIAIDPSFKLFYDQGNGGYSAWVIVVGAALIGVGIYSAHTGVIVRLLWFQLILYIQKSWLHHRWLSDNDRLKTVGDLMFELDTARWQRRASSNREIMTVQREMDRWASMLNFLYCSSYPLIVLPSCIRWSWFFFGAGLIVLFFAFVSDYQITIRELWATKKYPLGKEQ